MSLSLVDVLVHLNSLSLFFVVMICMYNTYKKYLKESVCVCMIFILNGWLIENELLLKSQFFWIF